METARPLRLKRQEGARLSGTPALSRPFAKVWVDNSVGHLDREFDYLVPQDLTDLVKVGVRVALPFAGRVVEGLVIARGGQTNVSNLKYISKVISPEVVASAALIRLIAEVSQRWLCHPFDLIRAAIPIHSAAVDKSRIAFNSIARKSGRAAIQSSSTTYLQLQPHEDPLRKLAEFASKESAKGSVLIVLPEDRELAELANLLEEKAIVLSSSLSRTERYANYLLAINNSNSIVIGTRSAIFATPSDLRTLIVYRETSQSHFEPRHPGWNVRDIALLRGESEGLNLYFVGYSPSLALAHLIEIKRIRHLAKKSRMKVSTFQPLGSELLPERIFIPIRNALKKGPVLFLVPKKGYASALLCNKCRNFAICSCGGKLLRRGKDFPPECGHCSQIFSQLRCKWCDTDRFVLIGRGAIRHAEEIGRAFPGFSIVNSDANSAVGEIFKEKTIVIATAGMAPRYEAGYSAVVLLEGNSFFSYADLCGQERSREAFFEAASKVRTEGEVLIAIEQSHPICAALASWNPSLMYRRELRELETLKLPPFSRSVILDMGVKEAPALADGFKKAILDTRLPVTTRVFGPAIRDSELARILITAEPQDFEILRRFLKEFIAKRAISKKAPIQIRIDPYSLS